MAYIIADNIISPLGETSEENYLSVKSGRSGIRAYEPGTCPIPEGFYASLLFRAGGPGAGGGPGGGGAARLFEDFETLALRSAQKAIANAQKTMGNERLELKGKRTAFILSSTKGNIEENISLADSAQRIASQLGKDSKPIKV